MVKHFLGQNRRYSPPALCRWNEGVGWSDRDTTWYALDICFVNTLNLPAGRYNLVHDQIIWEVLRASQLGFDQVINQVHIPVTFLTYMYMYFLFLNKISSEVNVVLNMYQVHKFFNIQCMFIFIFPGEIVLYNIFYELFTVCTSIVAEDPSGVYSTLCFYDVFSTGIFEKMIEILWKMGRRAVY